jgi:hypothetical protein
MTFKTMQDRVKYTLGMEENVWNDEVALIKAWLNEGIVDILARTRPYTRLIELQLTAGTAIHDMSNSIIALVDLEFPGIGFLKRYSREDITLRQAAGAPGFAYEEPLLWVSPIVTANTQINAYGVFRPAALSGDTDDPQNPANGGLAPEFHNAIVMYGLWKGGEYVQHEGSGQGEKWRMQYEGRDGTEGEIARIKRTLAKRVTPQASRRRDLEENVGVLSGSGDYAGAR